MHEYTYALLSTCIHASYIVVSLAGRAPRPVSLSPHSMQLHLYKHSESLQGLLTAIDRFYPILKHMNPGP